MLKKKRGLSPVIATTLLVAVGLILAVIIFIWARSFIGESIQKNGQAVELACESVSFLAEAISSSGYIFIENKGSIPLYGIEIRKKQLLGEITSVEKFSNTILAGETDKVQLPAGIEANNEIIVVPMLLGENEERTQREPYVCGENYEVEIIVQ